MRLVERTKAALRSKQTRSSAVKCLWRKPTESSLTRHRRKADMVMIP